MSHYHYIENDKGDLVDLAVFCSDWCHRQWCERNGLPYGGWNGCHEQESPANCGNCDRPLPSLLDEDGVPIDG